MARSTDQLPILYDDQHLVAINKPAGLASVPGRDQPDSALQRLARQLALPWRGRQDPRIRLVHRLDRHTSGLLLFARQIDAQRHLSHQFQNNHVRKEYLALVAGAPAEAEGLIDAPMARHPANPKRMTVFRHGRPARTLWRVEERFRGYTLLRVFPQTGKTHQIRVHLRHAGLPLAVDPLYNTVSRDQPHGIFLSHFKRGYRRSRDHAERPLIGRLTLHAHRLGFRHPDGRDVAVEAPLPKDIAALLNMLRKYAPAYAGPVRQIAPRPLIS